LLFRRRPSHRRPFEKGLVQPAECPNSQYRHPSYGQSVASR
jgi:hypothetical protein